MGGPLALNLTAASAPLPSRLGRELRHGWRGLLDGKTQNVGDLSGEFGLGEARGVALERGRVDDGLDGFETGDGGMECGCGGIVVEDTPCRIAGDAFKRAASGEGDDGLAAGERFDRSDSEIFFAGQEEGARARVELAQAGWGDTTAEFDIGLGERAQASIFGTVAYDAELAAAGCEGADSDIDALVGDEFGDDQEIIFGGLVVKRVHIDGRMDDLAFAAVAAPDATGDVLAVGDELVDALRGGVIPLAQQRGDGGHQRALPGGRPFVQVGGVEIPDIAHGRVAVADVAGGGGREDALGGAGFAADDEIVTREIELLEREWHYWEQRAIPAAKRVEERGADAMGADHGTDAGGIVEESEDIGIGEQAAEGFEDGFAAAMIEEPVVDQGDPHGVLELW